jgi:NAD(P)-dependent dehydrogenase (short-subunit alcohol dehydrogenase family)
LNQATFSLDGAVAVVTGAFGKLGPVWIEALLGAGARVMGLDHPDQRPGEAFAALQKQYGDKRLRIAAADVRVRGDLERACEACKEVFGIPAILINNAGIDQPPDQPGGGYRLEDIPLEINRKVFEVNTLGLFLVSQVFGQTMVTAGRGTIINIGSLYASVAPDSRFYDHIQSDPPFLKPPAYGASKAAVVNLTRYLATMWAPYGVRVNTLSPGGVLGGQDDQFKNKFCARVPMGRMATAEDLHGPLLFLASEASSYVTGTELVVDGGFTAW